MSAAARREVPTQVLYCSTLFGSLTVAAALDAGLLGPAHWRRIALVSDNGPAPEVGPGLADVPGFAVLRSRVDAVASYNAFVAPQHPSAWVPREQDEPVLARALERFLGLTGPPAGLVVESVAVAPARTLATLLGDGPVTVYSDGLMTYGPTRTRLPVETATRITGVVHLDLVPGLQPVLLREEGVTARALPDAAFTAVLAEAAAVPAYAEALAGLPAGGALVLGQYLSALGLVSAADEAELYAGMVRAAVRAGHRTVRFKPHPAAGPEQVRAVRAAAEAAGAAFDVLPAAVPAELCFDRARPDLVIGCFSTALLTAQALYGLPVAAMGTARVLRALRPYQNSNRIPATIVDALVPHLADDGTIRAAGVPDVPHLVEAVAYCMQPALLPELRPTAVQVARELGRDRYFTLSPARAAALLSDGRLPRRVVHSRLAGSPLARRAFVRALTVRGRIRARR